MTKTHLFACGTLRKDYEPKPKAETGGLVFVGTGTVKGRLYDLGEYPGAVLTEDGSEIKGDVFEVREADATLSALDEYEGLEFVREKVTVRTTDGDELEAWMYRYTGDATGKPVIENGDYLAHLKTKDSLR